MSSATSPFVSSVQTSVAGIDLNSQLGKASSRIQLDVLGDDPKFKVRVDGLDYKWYSWALLALSIIGIPIVIISRGMRAVKIDLGEKKIYLNIKSLKNRMNITRSEIQNKTPEQLKELFKSKIKFWKGCAELPAKICSEFSLKRDEIEKNGVLVKDEQYFYIAKKNNKGEPKLFRIAKDDATVFATGSRAVLKEAFDLTDKVAKAFKTVRWFHPALAKDNDEDKNLAARAAENDLERVARFDQVYTTCLWGEAETRAQLQTEQQDSQDAGVQDSEEMRLDFPQENIYGMIEKRYDGDLFSFLFGEKRRVTMVERVDIAQKCLKAALTMWKKGIPHGNIKIEKFYYFKEIVQGKEVLKIRLGGLPSKRSQMEFEDITYSTNNIGKNDFVALNKAETALSVALKAGVKPDQKTLDAALMKMDMVAMGITLIKIFTQQYETPFDEVELDKNMYADLKTGLKSGIKESPLVKKFSLYLEKMTDSKPSKRMTVEEVEAFITALPDFFKD